MRRTRTGEAALLTVHAQRAGVAAPGDFTHEQAAKRALAGPIRADKADNLAGGDAQ